MKPSKRTKWMVAILILIAICVLSWVYLGRKDKAADSLVGTVTRMDLVQRVTISGQIWPHHRMDVRPPFSGYIQKIFIKVGQTVKKGDPLVTFSPSLNETETNFPVRAVFNGLVTLVSKNEGEYVAENSDQSLVARVEDLTEFTIHASVPELDVAKIKIGQEAMARVSAIPGVSFNGAITEIGMSAKDKDRWSSASTEYPVIVSLKTDDKRLFPGMTAVLDVITNKKKSVLTLGHEFVQEDDKGNFVMLPGGKRQDVKIGLRTDEAVEIVSGLNEGQAVLPIDFLNLPKVED